jgi:hypothetical protein
MQDLSLTGFTDADGSMTEDHHAISGHVFLINGGAISSHVFLINGGAVSWSLKKQAVVSLSTAESEYVTTTHTIKEALWLWSFINEILGPNDQPLTLFSDNQSAIVLTHDHQYHPQSKHIDVHYHFIQWVIEEGKMQLVYCPTDDMVADVLTKVLPLLKVKHFTSALGLMKA